MKKYLGDGVYAEFDGFAINLTTEDGVSTTNRIVLEPQVIGALESFIETLKSNARAAREKVSHQ